MKKRIFDKVFGSGNAGVKKGVETILISAAGIAVFYLATNKLQDFGVGIKENWAAKPLLHAIDDDASENSSRREMLKTAPIEYIERMQRVFSILEMTRKNELARPVRIGFYSTSGNGFDRISSRMRQKLQPIFGDGGKGFLTLTKGWKYHKHQDIIWNEYGSWEVFNVVRGNDALGQYGIGGVKSKNKGPASVDFIKVPTSPNQYVPGTDFNTMMLYYKTGPGNGKIQIRVDNKVKKIIDTNQSQSEDRVEEIVGLQSGTKVTVRPLKAPVEFYGISFERDRGLVIDGLMIVGLSVKELKHFNASHLYRQLAQRNHDLLIFQLGENEAYFNPDLASIQQFEAQYSAFIQQALSAAKADCLVISIKDIGERINNNIRTRPGVAKIVDASRRVAIKNDCAFFDLFEALGGKGTIRRWKQTGKKLVSPDLGHLYDAGAKKVGDIISDSFLESYEIFTAPSQ